MATPRNLPVNLSDQQNINRYSYLLYQNSRTGRALDAAKLTVTNQQDALDELDTLELEHDDPPRIPVRIGNSFFHLPCEHARRQADVLRHSAETDLKRLQQEHDGQKEELGRLKKKLESKFGDSVRLE